MSAYTDTLKKFLLCTLESVLFTDSFPHLAISNLIAEAMFLDQSSHFKWHHFYHLEPYKGLLLEDADTQVLVTQQLGHSCHQIS